MFDFDNFVNKTCMEIFGRPVTYRPKNTQHQPFAISGDFHKSYMEVQLKNADADVTYQVMNIEHHIPGSRKLVLHEQ